MLHRSRIFGDNVFASVGETWKRHRRILAPAFTQSLYKNVWATSQKMYELMVEEDGWRTKKVVEIDDINKLTRKVRVLFCSSQLWFANAITHVIVGDALRYHHLWLRSPHVLGIIRA